MCGVLESHFDDQDAVDVFVPESGCFGVTLEVLQNRDDPPLGDGWVSKTIFPPVPELFLHNHVEWFFWCRRLRKGVADIASESHVVEGCNE